jgi:hypothetical protein
LERCELSFRFFASLSSADGAQNLRHKKAQKVRREINHELTRIYTDFFDADFAGYAEIFRHGLTRIYTD